MELMLGVFAFSFLSKFLLIEHAHDGQHSSFP